MKHLLFALVSVLLLSCSKGTEEKMLFRIHKLQSKIDSLSFEKDSLLNQMSYLLHERDSLLNVENDRKHRLSKHNAETYNDTIALRWSYGAGSYLWRGSLSPEEPSWEEYISYHQLMYDRELLNEEEYLKSANSNFTPNSDFYNIVESSNKKVFVVNTRFELERFDYYLSTEITNRISELIFNLAKKKISGYYDLNEDESYEMIWVYAGLYYRYMFRSIRESYTDAIAEYLMLNCEIY